MRLSDLRALSSSPYAPLLQSTTIWSLPADKLDNARLKATFELIRLRTDRITARKVIKAIINAVARADFFGEIELKEPLTFSDVQPLSLPEFNEHLDALDPIHKRIFLLALSLDISFMDAASYNWSMARVALRKKDLHPVARSILSTQVRCLTLDYVFYQTVNGRLHPMYDADTHIESVVGSTHEIYRKRYKTLINPPV